MLSEVRVVPEARLGFVILTNAEGHMLGPALAMRIIDAYLGAAPRDWSAVYLAMFQRARAQEDSAEKALAAARVPGTRPSLPLERYVGTYADTMYGTATVALERGALVVRYGPAFTGDLEHWHYDTFRVRWRDPRAETGFVTFGLGAAGTVTHMNVDGLADFRFTPASSNAGSAEAFSARSAKRDRRRLSGPWRASNSPITGPPGHCRRSRTTGTTSPHFSPSTAWTSGSAVVASPT